MSKPAESGSKTDSNPSINSTETGWVSAPSYSGKTARWLQSDASELYIQEDSESDSYLLEYREGRFGASNTLGVFDEEPEAILEAERSMDDPEYLEELR